MGRRRAKNAQRFFYDGYLQIADNSGNAYTWDCTEPVATRPLAWYRADSAAFYAHDGNKNVSEVFSSDGEIVAHYDYASFGGFTTQHGESAAINPWRFSAEYAEEDTATVYYNYRHSLQREGRWLSRDLIGEKDGGNEYAYNKNSLGGYDRLGLSCCGGNWGDFGSLITSHFLGESAGCIPPPGLVPNQSTANEPCSGSAGVSLAAYCVWGGSVSFESGICCQGGSRYRWVTMTTCVGLGVGAKLPTPDIPSVSKSGKGECPSEGTVYTIGTGFDLPFGTLGARAETFGISPVDGGYCSRKGCDVKDVCDFYQPSVGLSLAWRFFDICSTSRIKFERID
jgi:RHS repeat-associated protein